MAEEVEAPRRSIRRGSEVAKRVRDVVAGQPAQRRRDLVDGDDRPRLAGLHLRQRPAPHDVGSPAPLEVQQQDRRRLGRLREEGDRRGNEARDGRHVRVVRVEHHPAARFRDPADRGLRCRQLRERVHPLQVEVVGADVRQDAGLIALVADAPQEDPAAGRLQHGHVHVTAAQDRHRSAGAGPVARLHHAPGDHDPVGRRHADPAAAEAQDVGDHPGHRALAVRAGDGDDRDAAIDVADHRRAVGRGAGDPPGGRHDGGVVGVDALRVEAFFARQLPGGLGEGPGPLGAAPRERDDPAAGIGAAMDVDLGGRPLPGLHAEPAAPPGQASNLRRAAARRDVGPETRRDALGRIALAVPGLLDTHGDLDLHRRLEAVEVGPLHTAERAVAQGGGSIANAGPRAGGHPAGVGADPRRGGRS